MTFRSAALDACRVVKSPPPELRVVVVFPDMVVCVCCSFTIRPFVRSLFVAVPDVDVNEIHSLEQGKSQAQHNSPMWAFFRIS